MFVIINRMTSIEICKVTRMIKQSFFHFKEVMRRLHAASNSDISFIAYLHLPFLQDWKQEA